MTTILVVILAAGAALAGAAAAVQRARRRATECDLAERQQQLAAREAEAEGLRRELSTVRISTEGGEREAHARIDGLRAELAKREQELRELRDVERQQVGAALRRLPELVTESHGRLAQHLQALETAHQTSQGRTQQVLAQITALARRPTASQGAGALGEVSLANLLSMLGLRRGQDFQEQVTLRDPHSDATLRVDFVLRLGETRVAIDVKRSLAGSDDDLEQRGRKAKAQLDDLGTRRYGELLRSPGGFTLAFFPEEGIFDALAAVKGFDFHRFCAERRLWVTTPASLGAVIGLLRELDQERRREAEVAEQMLMLRELDGALCALRDQFLKLGRQLAGSVKAYNEILAMWGSRGRVGRILGKLRQFLRLPTLDEPAELTAEPRLAQLPRVSGFSGALRDVS